MTVNDILTIQRFLGAVEGVVCEVDAKCSDYILDLIVEVSGIMDREIEQLVKGRECDEQT